MTHIHLPEFGSVDSFGLMAVVIVAVFLFVWTGKGGPPRPPAQPRVKRRYP